MQETRNNVTMEKILYSLNDFSNAILTSINNFNYYLLIQLVSIYLNK